MTVSFMLWLVLYLFIGFLIRLEEVTSFLKCSYRFSIASCSFYFDIITDFLCAFSETNYYSLLGAFMLFLIYNVVSSPSVITRFPRETDRKKAAI